MGEAITVKTNMERSVIMGMQRLNIEGVRDLVALQKMILSKEFSPLFIQVVTTLIRELVEYCNLGETVSGEKDTFVLELKGVLRELGCPYAEVMEGNGLDTVKGRMFLLDYLISEVEACRMICKKTDVHVNGITDEAMEVDNPLSDSLFTITQALKIPMVSDLSQLFVNIQNKVRQLLGSLPSGYLKEPIIQRPLSAKQWNQASKINDALCQEYKMRREVLIKRLDVTIQSFSWSERTKRMANDISKVFINNRSNLIADSLTSLVDVLAARKDLCIIQKTCDGDARNVTKCAINKHMIGKVPDRGGRPSSIPPPPEMPSFQQRKPDQSRGGGRGRGQSRGGYQGGGGRGYQGGGGGGYQGGGGGGYQDGVRGGYQSSGGGGYQGSGDNNDGRRGSNQGGGGWRGRGGSSGGRYGQQKDQKQYYS